MEPIHISVNSVTIHIQHVHVTCSTPDSLQPAIDQINNLTAEEVAKTAKLNQDVAANQPAT